MLHNDEPAIADRLDRTRLVKTIGDTIAFSAPPLVIGVHGDWGAGKTSFLHQLQLYLTDACPQNDKEAVERVRKAQPQLGIGGHKDDVVVIWFEAWRYQEEAAPVVALLQEIRAQPVRHQGRPLGREDARHHRALRLPLARRADEEDRLPDVEDSRSAPIGGSATTSPSRCPPTPSASTSTRRSRTS